MYIDNKMKVLSFKRSACDNSMRADVLCFSNIDLIVEKGSFYTLFEPPTGFNASWTAEKSKSPSPRLLAFLNACRQKRRGKKIKPVRGESIKNQFYVLS